MERGGQSLEWPSSVCLPPPLGRVGERRPIKPPGAFSASRGGQVHPRNAVESRRLREHPYRYHPEAGCGGDAPRPDERRVVVGGL